ncbi:MAG: DUF4242 domain-containing protein [Candidatus Solibacter sp.]
MPRYMIERDIPNLGKRTEKELRAASQNVYSVAQQLGPRIQWVESFVTEDKMYCVYVAPNEQMLREHAQRGGFPANKISAVRSVIGPVTAEI